MIDSIGSPNGVSRKAAISPAIPLLVLPSRSTQTAPNATASNNVMAIKFKKSKSAVLIGQIEAVAAA